MKTLFISLLLGFTGTALIAEQTVPGDLLYPMKLQVNENVRHFLAVGSKAEARLALALLRERIREAGVLADEGQLTPALATEVNEAIAAQAARTGLTPSDLSVDNEVNKEEVITALESFKTMILDYQASLGEASTTASFEDLVRDITLSAEEIGGDISEDIEAIVDENATTTTIETVEEVVIEEIVATQAATTSEVTSTTTASQLEE